MAPIKPDIKFIKFTRVQFRNCSSWVAQRKASKFNKTSIANRGLVTSLFELCTISRSCTHIGARHQSEAANGIRNDTAQHKIISQVCGYVIIYW